MSLQEMTSFGFLNRAEYLELQDCQNFLWRVRFALHLAIQKMTTVCYSTVNGWSPNLPLVKECAGRTDDETFLSDRTPDHGTERDAAAIIRRSHFGQRVDQNEVGNENFILRYTY